MALLLNPFTVENINGRTYIFEKAGEVIPMHTHTEDKTHITVVVCGKIKVQGSSWDNEYGENEVIYFPENQEHEFIALEDNTRIVNIVK
jgi:quercetin dioxygenase-like cupin family protein